MNLYLEKRKKTIFLSQVFFLFLFILISSTVQVSGFGIDNPSLPHITRPIPTSVSNNNVSITNQTNVYTNITQVANLTNVAFTNQTNVFNQSQYVAEGKVIGFRGNVPGPDNDSYFFYNISNKRLQLWVNGKLQQEWGNSTFVYGTATFEAGIQGGQTNESGTVYNVSAGFFNGYLDWRYVYNVPAALNISSNSSLKLTDNDGLTTVEVERTPADRIIYLNSNGTDRMIIYPNGTIQVYADLYATHFIGDGSGITNITVNVNGSEPAWNGNSTLVRYNNTQILTNEVNKTTGTSYLGYLLDAILDFLDIRLGAVENITANINQTIEDLAKIKAYETNITLNVTGTSGIATSATFINYLITQIIVTPSNPATVYNFQMTATGGDMIDRDRINHTGVWNIQKEYAIQNLTVIANLTNVSQPDTFNVQIKFVDNFRI